MAQLNGNQTKPLYEYSEDNRRSLLLLGFVCCIVAIVVAVCTYKGERSITGIVAAAAAMMLSIIAFVATTRGGVYSVVVRHDRVLITMPGTSHDIPIGDIATVNEHSTHGTALAGGTAWSAIHIALKDGRLISLESGSIGNSNTFIAIVNRLVADQKSA